MKGPRAILVATLALWSICVPALAEDPGRIPERYRNIGKWAITYDDRTLGPVQGVAYCGWTSGGSCDLVLRDPKTNELDKLQGFRIPEGQSDPNFITIRIEGGSPYGEKVAAPPDPERLLRGKEGDTATIITRNGEMKAAVRRRTEAPRRRLEVDLVPQLDGSLAGRWRYFANPITERWHYRGSHGDRVGVFEILGDADIRNDFGFYSSEKQPLYGGFLGRQIGPEIWRPLTPRIAGVFVVEDQAAFDEGKPRYPHRGRVNDSRYIVVVGQDLPVYNNVAKVTVRTTDKDLNYYFVAADGSDRLTDFQKQQFALAWKELTKDMKPEEAREFRKLDAALVMVNLWDADPGPKTFSWGTADIHWDLQYGDNTADVHLIRAFNATETERVEQLALPDRLQIEVETGSKLDLDSIPVQIGGAGVAGAPINLVATRVSGKETLYRSPLLYFSDNPNFQSYGGSKVILVAKESRVLVDVDRSKTHFLRASVGVAVAAEPSTVWIGRLRRAARCNKAEFKEENWPNFAKRPAERISRWGTGIDISYGDHAAMLMLRDSFLQTMRLQRGELTTAMADDGLVDAWYGRMHDAVTGISKYPLAGVKVAGPNGASKVAYIEAYSADFSEKNFHPSTTVDGTDNYLKWRRQATKDAMAFFGSEMDEAIKDTEQIEDCDRAELVKLTGSGFRGISTRLASTLMKKRLDSSVTEPDDIARIYVNNVDEIAKGLGAVKDFGNKVNTAIVSVALVLIPPAAGAAWSAAGLAGAEGAGVLAGTVGGFAVFGYESAFQVYETYQQHADVRFAFATTSTLGLERYFDAKSKETEWWRTGVSIFGQAVLQGVGLRLAKKPMSEGLAAWRGQRIVADLPQTGAKSIYRAGKLAGTVPEVDLAALGKLPAEEQYAVGMFLLKEEERLAINGLVDDIRQYSNRVFQLLGRQAAKTTAKAELPVLARQLEAQGANVLDDFKAAKPPTDPLRLTKTELSESRMVELAREDYDRRLQEFLAAEAAEEAETLTPSNTLLARKAKVERAWPDGVDLPKLGVPWKTTINGKEVTFEVESFFRAGAFSRVYKLKSVPQELGMATQPGKKYVLKIVMKPEEIAGVDRIPGVKENIIQRMVKGRDLLRKGNVGQADFEAFEDARVLIQEYIPFVEQPGKYAVVPGFGVAEQINPAHFWANQFAKEKQAAIAELFNKLGDAEIAFLDAHGGNIYLEKIGEKWVAKILDQDFIVEFSKVNEGVYGHFLDMLQNSRGKLAFSLAGNNPQDPFYSTPRSLMQKVMEHQGWLKFNNEEQRFIPWVLDPQEVKKVMPDLLYVSPPPPPPPPLKKSQLDAPYRKNLAPGWAKPVVALRGSRSVWPCRNCHLLGIARRRSAVLRAKAASFSGHKNVASCGSSVSRILRIAA